MAKQSGAPADHIDVALTEDEINLLTSGEEEVETAQQEEDQPREIEVISIDLNEQNTPVSCKWGSFLFVPLIKLLFINKFVKYCTSLFSYFSSSGELFR